LILNLICCLGPHPQMDPLQESVVEATLQLAESLQTHVTAIAAGPEEYDQTLRRALALGCHAATRVQHLGADSNMAYWGRLAQAPMLADYPVLLLPTMDSDGRSDFPGWMAARLGRALLPNAGDIRLAEDGLEARCLVGGEALSMRASLPAIIAVSPNEYRPRLPKLSAILKARRAKIQVISVQGQQQEQRVSWGSAVVAPNAGSTNKTKPKIFTSGETSEFAAALLPMIRAANGEEPSR